MTEINAMDFTAELIKNYRLSKQYRMDTYEQKSIYDRQVKIEDRLLSESRVCSNNHGDGQSIITIADISNYNSDKFLEECRYRFWDINFMETVRCMINTIIDMKDGDEESERFRIHKFLDDIVKLGVSSVYNFALGGTLTDKYHHYKGKTVVIKCPREPFSAKELVHELVIGTCALNKLRSLTPNFSYVYDAFYCSAPVVQDNSGEIVNWCMKSDNAVSYVIYEAIPYTYNMRNFAEKAQYETAGVEFLSYMMQLALGLYLAQKEYDFCHCDLHNENVVLRDYVDEIFYIPYKFEEETFFVPSPGKIATIIDYGMSHIKLNDGEILSKLDPSGYFENIGIGRDTDVITDLYKLLAFTCKESIINNNDSIFQAASRFLTYYFYGNVNMPFKTLNDMLEIQDECFFNIPAYIVRHMGWNINDFIKALYQFTLNEYNMVLLTKEVPNGCKLFSSFTTPNKSVKVLKEELQLEVPEVPTLFDLYQSPNDQRIITNIKNNITTVLRDERMNINKLLDAFPESLYAIPLNEKSFRDSYGYAIISIDKLASVVTKADKLREKVTEYNRAIVILSNLPELETFIELCMKKYTHICSYLRRINYQLHKSLEIIDNYLEIAKTRFKRTDSLDQESKQIVDKENEDLQEYIESLMNIKDKYVKVIDVVTKMNIL